MGRVLKAFGVVFVLFLVFVGLVHGVLVARRRHTPETLNAFHDWPVIGGFFPKHDVEEKPPSPEERPREGRRGVAAGLAERVPHARAGDDRRGRDARPRAERRAVAGRGREDRATRPRRRTSSAPGRTSRATGRRSTPPGTSSSAEADRAQRAARPSSTARRIFSRRRKSATSRCCLDVRGDAARGRGEASRVARRRHRVEAAREDAGPQGGAHPRRDGDAARGAHHEAAPGASGRRGKEERRDRRLQSR